MSNAANGPSLIELAGNDDSKGTSNPSLFTLLNDDKNEVPSDPPEEKTEIPRKKKNIIKNDEEENSANDEITDDENIDDDEDEEDEDDEDEDEDNLESAIKGGKSIFGLPADVVKQLSKSEAGMKLLADHINKNTEITPDKKGSDKFELIKSKIPAQLHALIPMIAEISEIIADEKASNATKALETYKAEAVQREFQSTWEKFKKVRSITPKEERAMSALAKEMPPSPQVPVKVYLDRIYRLAQNDGTVKPKPKPKPRAEGNDRPANKNWANTPFRDIFAAFMPKK